MAFVKDSGRQYPKVAIATISYADFPVGTTDKETIDLPAGAIVIGGYVECVAAWATATLPTIDLQIGDVSYVSAPVALAAGTGAALVPTGTKLTANDSVDVTIGGSGSAATAGSARIIVEYVVDGAANEVFDK
jgi:hypothetical protein